MNRFRTEIEWKLDSLIRGRTVTGQDGLEFCD